MEAALWCFLSARSFDNAVLAAVNLGGDADITAAVCGEVWIKKLVG
jgi:ADP-ribosyl-[dinitrogen reductase] hydrolase